MDLRVPPVEKVYPTAEELSKLSKNQSCPECCVTFNSESNLKLHLAKTHKKTECLQSSTIKKLYLCPIETCMYSNLSHFDKLKALKQHFLKVHSERKFVCNLCQKGFPTEAVRNRHTEYCNISFKCCDCDASYNCYETLKTHGRRKKHSIFEKLAYKQSEPKLPPKPQKSDESLCRKKMRMLLPKPSSSVGMIIIANRTSEQSCQTEKSNRSTQETQTLLACRMPNLTVETQTIGDYFTRKPESFSSNLKSAKTQTVTADPKTASCNTSFSLDDFELGAMSGVQRNSSSTQTAVCRQEPRNVYPSTSTHDSIHTDTSDLLTETLDSDFFNCNTETQTDFIFNDELFKYCDDYTNMCTQTCDDLLLGEVGFNDTHTQTVFDDILKSVESQTMMSQSRMLSLSCKDNMTHMETQTESHFKQMLEEINA